MQWMRDAACAEHFDLMWPNDDAAAEVGRGAVREARAVALCRSCPVLDDCTTWVLSQPSDPCPGAIVAGMTTSERRALAAQLTRT